MPPATAQLQAAARRHRRHGQPARAEARLTLATLAAIGLVLTTLLGALGGIFAKILGKLRIGWQIPLAFIGILLAISLPSMTHRLAQIAQAQPRPDPRRQRLGGERQGQDERALRREPHAESPLCRPARNATSLTRSRKRKVPWPQNHCRAGRPRGHRRSAGISASSTKFCQKLPGTYLQHHRCLRHEAPGVHAAG